MRIAYSLVSLFLISPLLGAETPNKTMAIDLNESRREDQEKEYIYLDRQMESLENLKDYYMAKAARFRNRANRYQFQSGGANYPEAKKLWKEADEYDVIVRRINEELIQLEEQKINLQKKIEKEALAGQ